MDIEKLMLPIAEFTEYGEVCFAHLSENGEKKETLREHTELCQKYWKEIVKRKKIDEIFQEFENVYLEELSKESRNLFELMTVNIVSVHDLGKINPNFQSDKMHHKWHEEVKPDPNIGSRHSILSSVFYLDYFLGKNDHPADIKNVQIVELEETTCQEQEISGMFPKRKGELCLLDDEDDLEVFKYEENLPIALNGYTNLYEYEKFCYTNMLVTITEEIVYKEANRRLIFY